MSFVFRYFSTEPTSTVPGMLRSPPTGHDKCSSLTVVLLLMPVSLVYCVRLMFPPFLVI